MTSSMTLPTDQKMVDVFKKQKSNQFKVANSKAKDRIRKLDKLQNTVLKYKQEIREALWKDYKKPAAEVDLTEIYVVTSEVKHAKSNLKRWMSEQRVSTPLSMMGSSSWIRHEPKGVCLIIAPWNYPLQLTFGPLISAIAAGNTVIIKPSEHTPHCSAIMQKIIGEIFQEDEVAMFQGGVETATALLKLPFNHIFFTGAPEIGKIVMRAAANNLTSVTLELGGKSPTIIDETANISSAAKRIAWGKFSNNGQICIAPDYIYIHESKKDEFLEKLGKNLKEFYGDNVESSPDYMRIINHRHYQRLKSYLDNTIAAGAKIAIGGKTNEAENFIEPTVLTNVPMDSDAMQKEIFGPLLPVMTYTDLQEPLDVINSKEKPLALYIYSGKQKNIDRIVRNTRAGGTCINNNDVHFFNNNLPFGGSNNSGVGKSHGEFGFKAFSNARGFYKQHIPGALEMLMPPYNGFKQKLIDLTIKWF